MDQAIRKKYVYWEWRTIIVLMIGYAFYYFVRKNFSIAMPAMEASLGITKVQLGLFLTLNGIIYGISRFTNGILADRYSRRKLMTAGLVLSGIVNLLICFSPKMNGVMNMLDTEGKATMSLVYVIGSLWVINGYLQGMGVPPCQSLLAHWIKPSELATKQSIWNASHSIGAGLVSVLCGFLLKHFGYSAWQLCFAVPAIIAILGAAVIWFGVKDNPSSVGLPEIEELEKEGNVESAGFQVNEDEAVKGAAFKKLVNKMVFGNPLIWILAVSNFCIYVIRFTILDWGTSILTQYKSIGIATAGTVVGLAEMVGGILGMLVAGWVTDRYLKSKAHRTCFICTVCATVTFILFWKCTSVWAVILFDILTSFFIYGPQALLGTCASMQATKRAAATANGILGMFGYASTAVSGLLFGFLSQNYGWDRVFMVATIFGIAGAIVIAFMWNAPADGYAKADRIMADVKSDSQL
jgi:OPA family glycerol-3-phosphate transporter-like MFS transporter/OPA family sugar phosphate sensor protein UhpC-like MFS transporter